MDFRLVTVDERDVAPQLRADLDALLGTVFESVRQPPRGRGWTHTAPAARVVATDSACAVIGQVALVDAGRNRPAAGIADLVVDSERRGQGVGSALLDAALESPLARRAEAVFAASAHPGVRHHLRRRGFRPARPFELYWVARDGCHRNPDWVVRRASSGALEVIGDV